MIIDLPDTNFEYKTKNGEVTAYIDQNLRILKINECAPFKNVMKAIAFEIARIDNRDFYRCPYCHKIFHRSEMTIDHIVPQAVGGPTITNNLVPVDHECNEKKSNMPIEIFKKYLKAKNEKEKEIYRKKAEIENENLKHCKDFSFLGDWVIVIDRNKIKYSRDDIFPEKWSTRYTQRAKFFKKYGRSNKAILVDKNYCLLGGAVFLKYAIDYNIEKVWVIVCENIEVNYNWKAFQNEYNLYQNKIKRKG